jgi:predicted ATPase
MPCRFLFYYEGALAYKPFLDDMEAAKATHSSAKREQRDTSYMASSFFSRSIMDTSLRDVFTAELASHIEVVKDETVSIEQALFLRVLTCLPRFS